MITSTFTIKFSNGTGIQNADTDNQSVVRAELYSNLPVPVLRNVGSVSISQQTTTTSIHKIQINDSRMTERVIDVKYGNQRNAHI